MANWLMSFWFQILIDIYDKEIFKEILSYSCMFKLWDDYAEQKCSKLYSEKSVTFVGENDSHKSIS